MTMGRTISNGLTGKPRSLRSVRLPVRAGRSLKLEHETGFSSEGALQSGPHDVVTLNGSPREGDKNAKYFSGLSGVLFDVCLLPDWQSHCVVCWTG